jgi:Tol biopolymer transport system component
MAESEHYSAINGLAWSPRGDIWFTASPGENSRSLRAMNLKGQTRDVYRAPSDLTLYDIAPNGRVLLTNDNSRMLMLGGATGQADKDLSWFNWSLPGAISADGSTVAFNESAAAVGGEGITLLRKLDGSPAVRLGEGMPTDLSPDGNWVSTLDNHQPPNIVLLPTGVGRPKQLTSNGWDYNRYVRWMPDGTALLVNAGLPDHKHRTFLLNISTLEMRAVLPEGVDRGVPSPDGKFVAAYDGNTPKIYTIAGAEVRALPSLASYDLIDKWIADGKSLLVWNYASSSRLDRMDIASGKRVPLTAIKPPDNTGVVSFAFCRATPDGKFHVYSEYRLLTDLFVVSGFR